MVWIHRFKSNCSMQTYIPAWPDAVKLVRSRDVHCSKLVSSASQISAGMLKKFTLLLASHMCVHMPTLSSSSSRLLSSQNLHDRGLQHKQVLVSAACMAQMLMFCFQVLMGLKMAARTSFLTVAIESLPASTTACLTIKRQVTLHAAVCPVAHVHHLQVHHKTLHCCFSLSVNPLVTNCIAKVACHPLLWKVWMYGRGEVVVGAAHSKGRRHHWRRDGTGQDCSAGSVPSGTAPQQHVQAQPDCLPSHGHAAVAAGAEGLVPPLQGGHPA